MRFFLLSLFFLGCQSGEKQIEPTTPPRSEGVKEPVVKKVEKAPDLPVPAAFTKPANLKNAPSNATTTESGLAFLQLKAGDESSESPNLNSVISVRFSGWTPEGKSFQKSKEDRPFKQRVGNLLKGWQEGVVSMKKGEVRRLWMPGKLAYDNDPNPNSQKGPLIFDIELIDFKNKK